MAGLEKPRFRLGLVAGFMPAVAFLLAHILIGDLRDAGVLEQWSVSFGAELAAGYLFTSAVTAVVVGWRLLRWRQALRVWRDSGPDGAG